MTSNCSPPDRCPPDRVRRELAEVIQTNELRFESEKGMEKAEKLLVWLNHVDVQVKRQRRGRGKAAKRSRKGSEEVEERQ